MKTQQFILSVMMGLAICVSASAKGHTACVKTGIDMLQAHHFDVLKGKRVGLCTNPTGVNRDLKSTIDILFEAPEVNLVALYGPEHGVRGNVHAGDHVDNTVDAKTGITMYSLYGATHKPTPEMMAEIDALVYDIQDNGCRSYTYISTMGKLMEACAENDKELIILDRPNPLGGEKIEGCLAEDGYISFVSQFKIPYLYGQTCGELALYLNAQSEHPCRLTVVKMEGWKRSMTWDETGLEWVVASPHVPHGSSCYFYPATGIMGEFGYYNIGVGYTLPFEMMGTTWITSADSVADALNALHLPGVTFRPIYFKPFYSVGQGEQSQGVQIHFMDYRKARLSEIQFYVVQVLKELYPEHDLFRDCNQKRFSMFDKVCGTNYIREHFGQNYRWDDVKDYWYKDVESYRKASSKYYLYK